MPATHPSMSARAVRKVISLASEQREAQELKDAILLVSRFEKKLQAKEDSKANPRPRRSRKKKLVFVSSEWNKSPRKTVKDVSKRVLFGIQNALKRYLLMKGNRAYFKIDCSKGQYLALVRGYMDVYKYSNGDMHATVTGEHTEDVVSLLSKMLGVKHDWWAHRAYGKKSHRTRDVAFLEIDPESRECKEVQFSWKTKHLCQVDLDGKLREVSNSSMMVKLPRHCAPVAPKPELVAVYNARKRARKAERAKKRLTRDRKQARQSFSRSVRPRVAA